MPYRQYGAITSDKQDLAPVEGIPTSLPAKKFIFTGGQNGCSLLLMKGTGGTVSAFHYPNSDGKKKGYPLLQRIGKTKGDILLAIDFDLYGDAKNPNACSFFFCRNREWIGVTQPQVQGMPDLGKGRCSMSINKEIGVRVVTTKSIGTA